MKAEAIEGLYDQLETVEGQQEIYRIAAARDQSGKDICQIRNVKSATGEVLMKDGESKERWGQYFNMLMNKENPRVETEDRDPNQAINQSIFYSISDTYSVIHIIHSKFTINKKQRRGEKDMFEAIQLISNIPWTIKFKL